MNHAVLCVEVASAEAVTCKIVVIPDDMLHLLAPATIYSAEQLALLDNGRACVPTLQNLPAHPTLMTMAAAIPAALMAGQRLPYLSVITGTDAQAWIAPTTFALDHGDITTLCNPLVVIPSISDAWSNMATITYGLSGRDLLNPQEYDPPVTSGSNDLYFPILTHWTRVKYQPMRDFATQSGGYWYLSQSLFYPEYTGLYIHPLGSDISNHFYINPPTHYSIGVNDLWGLFFRWSLSIHGAPPCTCATWRINGGSEFSYGDGVWGNDWVESVTPYHWRADTPAVILPKKKKIISIVAPVTAIGILGLMFLSGATSPAPGRRRKKS